MRLDDFRKLKWALFDLFSWTTNRVVAVDATFNSITVDFRGLGNSICSAYFGSGREPNFVSCPVRAAQTADCLTKWSDDVKR
jgi:hypothetical protein